MSKFMKFWLLIICFLFIFLIIFTDRVNAQEYLGSQFSNYTSTLNQTKSLSGNNVLFEFNMDKRSIQLGNQYETLIFNIYGTYINTSISGSIDLNLTCNNTGAITQPYLATITYADGTQANILYSEYTEMCNNYYGGNTILEYPNEDNQVWISAFIQGGSSGYSQNICKVEQNYVICPIKELNYKVDKIYLQVNRKVAITHNYILGLSNTFSVRSENETQVIQQIQQGTQAINNQTQQQQQNADREYNYISNTTISNENYTNTQTISDNNTNTQTKSVVMNFWLIPLNFFNSIIASFENTCAQVCVGECGSGHDNAWRFVFPCLDIKGFVGNTIYNTIDAFFAIGMIFAFVKRAKNFFINALMLTNDVASEVSVF